MPDAIADPSFDRYARMVSRHLNVAVSTVTFVEDNRQIFPGAHGLPPPFDAVRCAPLAHSLCQYVVSRAAPFIVEDVFLDELSAPHVDFFQSQVGAYAGWPISDHRGRVIGSLCAVDARPRAWSTSELEDLEDLAAACSAEISQRELRRLAVWEEDNARELVRRSQLLLDLSAQLSAATTMREISECVEHKVMAYLSCQHAAIWLLDGVRSRPSHLEEEVRTLSLVSVSADPRDAPSGHAVFALIAGDNPVGDACLRQLPRYYASRQEQRAAYPALGITESFGNARAFLPLTLGDKTLGILVLSWPGERIFGHDDRATLAALATYTAQAVHRAQLLQSRLTTSLTLQSAMLTELPSRTGLEFSARYRPASEAEQIGGDWYDAVALPSGGTGVVCGDVVGHDMTAAAAMGQVRSMLRSLAWSGDAGPAETVEQLDRALPVLGIDALATLVYARIDPPLRPGGRWRLRWTSAGHPPPVLVDDELTVRLLESSEQDLMIGVLLGGRRSVDVADVPEGSVLFLYTDGLVERREESLDRGLERLTTALAAAVRADSDLDAIVDGVVDELLPHPHEDDVAVLAVRFGRPASAAVAGLTSSWSHT